MTKNKTLIAVTLLIAVGLAVLISIYYRQYAAGPRLSPVKTEQQLLEKLTAPSSKEVLAPKEVTDKLTAPKKSVPVSSEIIDKLSAPIK